MVIAGRTQMMDSYPVPAALKRMRELGFDGVEICIENRDFTIRDELLDPAHLQVIEGELRQQGFRSWSYSHHADYINNDDVLERTLKVIEMTRSLGTDLFVFSGARSDKSKSERDEWKLLLERTRLLVTAAEANGVRLALETEPGFICGTSGQLIKLIDAIGSPALGANLDIGHAFLVDPEPLQAIADLGQSIFHVHVENMRRGVHSHLPPEEGDMDLNSYFEALLKAGFTGQAALDLYAPDYEAVAARSVAYLRALPAMQQRR